jgi:hypothetical protein
LLVLAAWNLPAPFAKAFTPPPMAMLPPTILWAWERPEQLKFIDVEQTGVAFLARTVYLRGDDIVIRPRLQPLEVPHGAALMAVARIESDPRQRPTLSPAQAAKAATAVADLQRLADVRAVQIDFDASQTERDFYRRLLGDLRRTLQRSTPISITVLASWCIHDDWLGGLPIDEAVPMLFRMGTGRREVVNYLNAHKQLRSTACRGSIGISTDEPLATLPSHQRKYVFNPQPWTADTVASVVKEPAK